MVVTWRKKVLREFLLDVGPDSESYSPLGVPNLELAKVWLGSVGGEASRPREMGHILFFLPTLLRLRKPFVVRIRLNPGRGQISPGQCPIFPGPPPDFIIASHIYQMSRKGREGAPT